MLIYILAWIAAAVADFATTMIALRSPKLHEGNPVQKKHTLVILIALKLAYTGLVVVLWHFYGATTLKFGCIVGAVMSFGAAAWNAREITKYGSW